MTTYSLQYEDDGLGLAKRVEFEGRSAALVLWVAHGEAEGRWAKLFADGRPICRLGRSATSAGDFWILR